MNFSADPCEDFFAFTCNNYSMPQLTNYDYSMEDAEVKGKQVYKQCLDNRLVGPVDVNPVLNFMKQIMPGGWPMANANWDASKFDLYTTLLDLTFYGTYPFSLVEVDAKYLNPTQNILNLAQPITFASKDTLLSDIGLATSNASVLLILQTSQLLLRQ
ncbi:hypothetical protein RvY_11948 [Ramazzottius varieornatus]|uniref:Peptidase M13 N-terminal domain-containing protein n=1 Tax=Ramazzottius varieornatus TaxID=947166 RepID=A0A1D1VJV6_RAMVA|nr:hypothetical protein RvY_11948 [Ramazzottius varieornatus]